MVDAEIRRFELSAQPRGDRMGVIQTPIPGLMIVETEFWRDDRGAFGRLYCERELAPILAGRRVVQINHSRTEAVGTVRGLHYQRPPHAETKIVRCLRGRVWDVVIDLRRRSPTFLRWHATELTPASGRALVVPEGCAHGFQVLDQASELLYLHTACFEQAAEGGVRYDDPAVAITWPLKPDGLSARDLSHPLLRPDYSGMDI